MHDALGYLPKEDSKIYSHPSVINMEKKKLIFNGKKRISCPVQDCDWSTKTGSQMISQLNIHF